MLRKLVSLTLLCFILFCSGLAVFAQPKILLPEITGLVSADGNGAYQRILTEAARRAGLSYTVELYPKARALSLFLNGGYDGIFTYTQTARDHFGKSRIIASYPFGAYRGFVFTAPGVPAVSDFKSLKGKPVGGLLGFEGTYRTIEQAGAQLNLVNEDAQNIGMLRRGRIAAMLGFLPDLFTELPGLVYDPAHPFFEAYDRLTMFDSPENQVFLSKLSAALTAMHRDGSIARIVGAAYLPVNGDFPPDR